MKQENAKAVYCSYSHVICWFYDKDSTPTMAEGPVRVNVFARIEGDAEAFYKASADTRITGVRNVRISLIEE